MKKILLFAAIAVQVNAVINSPAFSQGSTSSAPMEEKGLKDYYRDYFTVGVAVSPRAFNTDEAQLILTQFNSLTAENAMKMGPIHPKENEFFWRDADSVAAFARRNNLKLRGHTLCWHKQTPGWMFKDKNGGPVTKEVLLERLKNHITTVVSRYKDVVYAWDVVNEAISDNKDEYLVKSPWSEICGEEYIARAFEWAHEADPDALLFYNDYNEINTEKRKKIIRLVNDLKTKGIPVHGIGLQGHWSVTEPTKEQLEQTLSDFSKTGLKIHITELDISTYQKEHSARERKVSDTDTLYTGIKEQSQADMYNMIFKLFRKYKTHIGSVTFWNISDRHSWLDNFPVRGRKDYPLLFDRQLKPKKAYWEVVNF